MAGSHTYTDEYRRECADLVIASGRPAAQMADEIGVNRKTLQHWVQRRKMETRRDAGPRRNIPRKSCA